MIIQITYANKEQHESRLLNIAIKQIVQMNLIFLK